MSHADTERRSSPWGLLPCEEAPQRRSAASRVIDPEEDDGDTIVRSGN